MNQVVVKSETREWLVIENKGEKIFGVLHIPLIETKKVPVVITLHGFASSKLGTNRSYVKLAQKLTEAGIAVFRFDFRGSGDSEGDLSKMGIDDLVSDAVKSYQTLSCHDRIDPDCMAVFGSSLGGSIAIVSALEFKKIRALAVWAPVANGELWLYDWLRSNPAQKNSDPRKALITYQGITLNPVFQEQFGKLSAVGQITQLSHIPFLHLHGENDSTISILHQQAFQKARKNAQAESTFIIYPESEHALGYASAFPNVMQETVEWFKKHLDLRKKS